MPLRDDVKESHEKLEGKPFKYKVQYFIEYYKWHTIGAIVIIAFVFSLIKTFVTHKDYAFQALFINSIQGFEITDFARQQGIDTDKYQVLIDDSNKLTVGGNAADPQSNYATAQKIVAMVSARDVDVMIAPQDVISYYSNLEMYGDLRDYFSEDFLNSLGDKVIWYDLEIPGDGDTVISKHLPIAIDVTDAKKLNDNICFYSEYPILYTIIVNSKAPEYGVQFYTYINE